MPLLIDEADIDVYHEAVTLGRALVVSPGLFDIVKRIRQMTGQPGEMTGQPGGEEAFIDLLLNLLARQAEVTMGDEAEFSLDEAFIDRLVLKCYVGHVAVTAAEETLAMVEKVKELDQVETDGQTGPSTTPKENL